ncbi:MAG: hypothetical protein VKL60_06275 [Sphaerospermopsis sp.]|nr:hypothetical protein [Sphaerospermopsis sp.]
MDSHKVINYLDELLYSQKGKHLDTLQVSILEGVLSGQKYPEIAQEHKYTKNHIKDEAYKLWQLLSDLLDEDINKSNFCATIQRLGVANNRSKLFNPVQIGEINFCSNSHSDSDMDEVEESINDGSSVAKIIEDKTKRKMIPRLITLGLTIEQVSEALELSVEEVKNVDY